MLDIALLLNLLAWFLENSLNWLPSYRRYYWTDNEYDDLRNLTTIFWNGSGVRLVVLKPNRSELYSPYRHLSTNKLLDWGRSYCRSSHQTCSLKKCVLRNFTKFTGKHLCQWIFVNFAKFLRTLFLQNTSAQLHLILIPLSSSSFMRTFPIM